MTLLLACGGGGGGGTETDGSTSTSTSTSTSAPTTGETTTGTTTTGETTLEPTTGDTTTGGMPAVPEPPGEEVEWDKARDEDPDISAAELAAMAADERAFGLALFAALPPGAKNVAIAPTSIRLAFGQTYAGARTISKAEIETALKFSLPPEKIHAGLGRVDLDLAARDLPPSGDVEGDDSVTLRSVNEVFGRLAIEWEPAFLDILAESYGSSMHLLDFKEQPEPSRLAINQWVNDVTHDKIPELLPTGLITPMTTTVLVNAMYLKAPWLSPFDDVDEGASFKRLDDTDATVAMMTGIHESAGYVQGAGYEAAELALRGDQLTLVVIVPEAGTFAQFAGALDGAGLAAIFDALTPTTLEVKLPRFKVKADLSLKQALTALGIVSSWELGGGDFSGMGAGGGGWAIADVVHDVFVGVDEKGIEAAAASAVVLEDTDSQQPEPSAYFTADRPFLFAICDRDTDSLLFFGQVVDPSK